MGDSLVARLHNWGIWSRIDPDRPDGSCQNPFWERMLPESMDDGYGEVEASTIVIHYAAVAPLEREIDESDAECVDVLVRQMPSRDNRVLLVRRFVLRHKIGWQELDPAVRALQDVIDANRKTVDYVQGRLRG